MERCRSEKYLWELFNPTLDSAETLLVYFFFFQLFAKEKKKGEKSLSINNNKHFVNVVHISLKTVLVFFFLELDLLLVFF